MIELIKRNMLDVIVDSEYKSVSVLIFASKARYGGGYKNHSKAQEEYFFNHTDLPEKSYPKNFYPCTDDRTDGFVIGIEKPRKANCLFVPALVWDAVDKKINREKITAARIETILQLAKHVKTEHLVLGAWGCGVYRNPPGLIARLFGQQDYSAFKKVSFCFTEQGKMEVFKEYVKAG